MLLATMIELIDAISYHDAAWDHAGLIDVCVDALRDTCRRMSNHLLDGYFVEIVFLL